MSPLSSDQELIHSLRAGDESAFERVYDVYYDRLWRFAKSFVRSEEIAQEIVHDTFLRLWTTHTMLEIHTTFEGYLYGMVRNRALHLVKRARVAKGSAEREESLSSYLEAHATQAPDPLTAIERKEISRLLNNAIDSLPERQKSAILLRWSRGMRYEEIGAILEVSPQAARTLVLRVQLVLKGIVERLI